MEKENFEENLIRMEKPQLSGLKHQDMLANSISKAKDKSVLSWWWLCIPFYIIAALIMKTLYSPGTTFSSNFIDMIKNNKYSSFLFFIVVPVIMIIINFISIRKIYLYTGSPALKNYFISAWFNFTLIIASILVILIYLL